MTRPTGEDAISSEHVEVLERLRGVLEHGKMGDKCLIAPDLVTAAIAALSAPQPPTEAQPVAWLGSNPRTGVPEMCTHKPVPSVMRDFNMRPLIYGDTAPPSAPVGVEALTDPATVHAMMLRGVIAIPSWRSIVDLRGEVPNGEEVQLARIAELQEALAQQPAAVDGADWRGLYRHQTAMRYLDNSAQLTKDRAYRMADNDIANLELQQGGRSDDR